VDKTSPNPFAEREKREVIELEWLRAADSSMIDFPNYYKIISMEMYVSSDKKRIARKTHNLLDMLSAIGGLFATLNNILMIFVSLFSLPMMNA
jgi:hypothetical protein